MLSEHKNHTNLFLYGVWWLCYWLIVTVFKVYWFVLVVAIPYHHWHSTHNNKQFFGSDRWGLVMPLIILFTL